MLRGHLVEVLQVAYKIYQQRLHDSWYYLASDGDIDYAVDYNNGLVPFIMRLYKNWKDLFPDDSWVDEIKECPRARRPTDRAEQLMRRYILFNDEQYI